MIIRALSTSFGDIGRCSRDILPFSVLAGSCYAVEGLCTSVRFTDIPRGCIYCIHTAVLESTPQTILILVLGYMDLLGLKVDSTKYILVFVAPTCPPLSLLILRS